MPFEIPNFESYRIATRARSTSHPVPQGDLAQMGQVTRLSRVPVLDASVCGLWLHGEDFTEHVYYPQRHD